MTARQLDGAVAVHCFGWRWWVHAERGFRVLYPPEDQPDWMAHNRGPWMHAATAAEVESVPVAADWDRCASLVDADGRFLRVGVPRYSTSLDDARLVLEWLRGAGCLSVGLVSYFKPAAEGAMPWYVEIGRADGSTAWGYYPSLAEGVCRLAVSG